MTEESRTHHQVLVICVLQKGEQAVIFAILPHDYVEIYTVGYLGLPASTGCEHVNVSKSKCWLFLGSELVTHRLCSQEHIC